MNTNQSRLAAGTALLGLLIGIDATAASTTDDRPVAPAVEYVDVPVESRPVIDWAIDLFDEAGLALPPLRFVHHGDDRTACSGRIGVHAVVEGTSVVHLCTTDTSWPTQVNILHETAHAWVDHAVDEERRAAFREVRGFSHWRDYELAAWHENGTEQAAEIMVWGLADRPMAMLRIHDHSCDALETGYVTLTGAAPLHGFTDLC